MVVLVANPTACATLKIFPTDDSMFSEAQKGVVGDVQRRWMECSVEESKNAGCWMKSRGQGAKVYYCAWQIGIYEL